MMRKFVLIGCLLFLAACDRGAQPEEKQAMPVVDAQVVAQGERLYATHCASCHGKRAEGAPNWQRPDAAGKYPPPPLDGTGHAWHHPLVALRAVIKAGTANMGGNMPAWNEKLSDAEINAIIAWFQSQWPAEIFEAWRELDAGSAKQAP